MKEKLDFKIQCSHLAPRPPLRTELSVDYYHFMSCLKLILMGTLPVDYHHWLYKVNTCGLPLLAV